MKTLQVSERNFKLMKTLYDEFCETYGDENTEWEFDDVNAMREIGQEFMEIFSDHLAE